MCVCVCVCVCVRTPAQMFNTPSSRITRTQIIFNFFKDAFNIQPVIKRACDGMDILICLFVLALYQISWKLIFAIHR